MDDIQKLNLALKKVTIVMIIASLLLILIIEIYQILPVYYVVFVLSWVLPIVLSKLAIYKMKIYNENDESTSENRVLKVSNSYLNFLVYAFLLIICAKNSMNLFIECAITLLFTKKILFSVIIYSLNKGEE